MGRVLEEDSKSKRRKGNLWEMPRLKPYVSMHNCIQLNSTFLSFQVFPFSWFPAALFFNVNKNLGKPILEILLIFLHSFMVNQNEKWWHIQLFLFCWITSFFVWSKLAQFGGTVSRRERGRDRHPKGCSSFCLFNSTKDHHSRDSITNEKKTKRIFLGYWNFLCTLIQKNICVMCINQLSFCVKEAEGGISAKQNWPHKSWLCQKCLDWRQKSSFGNSHFFTPSSSLQTS